MNFFSSTKAEEPKTPEPVQAPPVENKKPQPNPLLENLDRTVFTFNMHNLAEMCFQHVVKASSLQQDRTIAATQKGKALKLPRKIDAQVQLCI